MIFSAFMAACGSMAVRPVSSPGMAAAYGNVTLPEGNIFFENLQPGKYYLMGFMSGQNAFYFNYRGVEKEKFINEVAIDIKPGSTSYMGSYEVTGIDRNFFKSNTFDIRRSDKPSRNAILAHLKEAAAGTGWDERFEQAMK
jgi:hypothetical protein